MLRSGAKVTLQVAAAKGGQVLPSVASATSGQSVQGTPSRSRGICLAGTRMDPGENLVSQLRLPTALGPGQPVATQSRNEHPQPPLQSFPQRHPHLPGPTRRCPRPEAAVAPPPPSDVRSSASANRTALHESGRSPSKGVWPVLSHVCPMRSKCPPFQPFFRPIRGGGLSREPTARSADHALPVELRRSIAVIRSRLSAVLGAGGPRVRIRGPRLAPLYGDRLIPITR